MFTWLNKQGVRSDEGFEVQRTGRFTDEYRDGGRSLVFYVDPGAGGWISFYDDAFEPLLEGIENPFERRTELNRIVRNISAAFEFQGMRTDVVSGPEPQ